MFSIRVFDDKTNLEIGKSKMNEEAYKWNHNIANSFGFIPFDSKYVYGIFLLRDAEEIKISEKEFIYKVSKYKLLLRNINPDRQFDDIENSKWIEL